MCRGSHLDLKVASKDNKWFRNAALKQDRIVIETRATLNVAAMIGAYAYCQNSYWSYKIINKLGKSVVLDFFTNCSDLCLDMPRKGGDK